MDQKVVAKILQNYSALRQDAWGNFESDTWYLLEVFDDVSSRALSPHPILESIVTLKIDGLRNQEIRDSLISQYGTSYTKEYISSLWRHKIPRLITEQATADFLYHQKKLPKKICGRCGLSKPAHSHFFSKNGSSPDGFYSICKECRRNKKKGVTR